MSNQAIYREIERVDGLLATAPDLADWHARALYQVRYLIRRYGQQRPFPNFDAVRDLLVVEDMLVRATANAGEGVG